MKLRCAIVDDEPLSVEIIENFIEKIPDVDVVATFADAVSAVRYVNDVEIDFLFLDIEMPKLSGLDFLRSLPNPPLTIITSANKSYAIEGFDLNVVDYILKPITFSRLVRSVNKVSEFIEAKKMQNQTTQMVVDSYIMLKENKKMVRLNLNDIQYFESDKDYVKVVTPDRVVVTKQNISFFEKVLNPNSFIRIHRSFIVAYKHIVAYSNTSVEVGKIEIPFGRLYKENVLDQIEKYFRLK